MKEIEAANAGQYCNYNIKRIDGFKFVRPILWVDEDCESDKLAATKQKITEIIEKYKQSGNVNNASVYLRSNGVWTSVNPDEKYEPGSLFKVPILIAVLKMEENNPGFLNKVVTYNQEVATGKNVRFVSKAIVLGKSYSIRELLTYMIKYSDNAATILLEKYMEPKTLQKLFKDLGVEVPNLYANKYYFNAHDYTLFMRAIFNAGYLTISNSEYAAELLSECDFEDGIVKGLPPHTKIAHKFGESGTETEKQLHESAVVYIDDKAYMITVMTKGKDMKTLSALLSEISSTVYNDEKNRDN
ncbi:serine hydrolase [Flavobacterium sp. XGLA_31]|uniref:serine hydrolase n=1 Tax=Flavobacterium sp. XGLA_31 TaxID=3447666 RepID=UPI003F324E71